MERHTTNDKGAAWLHPLLCLKETNDERQIY
jgi:hypothetical protein